MSLSDQPTALYPRPQHALGKESQRRILCNESSFRIYHESIIQDEQHSRFYQFANDSFIFILSGQAYLSDSKVGTALNQYEGAWMSPLHAHKLVLLSPNVELLVVSYQGNLAPCANDYYLITQNIPHLNKLEDNITRQTISHIDSLSIELEIYSSKHAEHLHYHRQAQQFIIALEGCFDLQQDKEERKLGPLDWALVNAKQRHRLKNTDQEQSLCLSIYSPPPAKDRVLVIKKNNA